MSRSPDNETVTPGRMALLLSVTAPTIDPVCSTCACAEVASSSDSAAGRNALSLLIRFLPPSLEFLKRPHKNPPRSQEHSRVVRRVPLCQSTLRVQPDTRQDPDR